MLNVTLVEESGPEPVPTLPRCYMDRAGYGHGVCLGAGSDGYKFTALVGSFRSNPFGLYDMLGNLLEWCEDVYDKKAYSKHAWKNPVIASGGSSRVIRGGGWYIVPRFVRADSRGRYAPDDAYSIVGFRVCAPRVR